jgi:hypothetical protein
MLGPPASCRPRCAGRMCLLKNAAGTTACSAQQGPLDATSGAQHAYFNRNRMPAVPLLPFRSPSSQARRATENPLLAAGAQSCTDRVRLNVRYCCGEVPLVADVAVEVIPVPKLTVSSQQAISRDGRVRLPRLDDARQALITCRHQEHVHMIRHNHPRRRRKQKKTPPCVETIATAIEVEQGFLNKTSDTRIAKPRRARALIQMCFNAPAPFGGSVVLRHMSELVLPLNKKISRKRVG